MWPLVYVVTCCGERWREEVEGRGGEGRGGGKTWREEVEGRGRGKRGREEVEGRGGEKRCEKRWREEVID